jgi:DNA-binding transcriptional ArsR family regulator
VPRDDLLSVIKAVRAVQRMPDGSPMPPSLGHALVILATYYPHIWPSLDRLAADMKITRRGLTKRLAALEEAGLIRRHQRTGTTTEYRLNLRAIREGWELRGTKGGNPRTHKEQEEEENGVEPLPY